MEYPELEVTHLDHPRILHMSCTGPPQESRCAESIVQTLPQLQQAVVCEHLPGEPVPAPKQPLGEEPFPNAQPKPPVTQLHVLPTGSKGILTGSVSLLQSDDEEVICKLPKVCIYLKLYRLIKKLLCNHACPNFSYREEINLTENFFFNVFLSDSRHRKEFQISIPLIEVVAIIISF